MAKAKKLFVAFIFFFLFFTFRSNAQTTIGFKGGVNYSQVITKEPYQDQSYIIGYNYGAYMNIYVNGNFSIQPELFLTQKGYYYLDTDHQPLKTRNRYNYFQIPVLFRFTGNTPTLSYYFAGGPTIGYATSGWFHSYDLRDPDQESFNEILFDNTYHRFEFSLTAVTGLELDFGMGFLIPELRYNYTLTPLNTDKIHNPKTSTISFSLGYGIYLGARGRKHVKY